MRARLTPVDLDGRGPCGRPSWREACGFVGLAALVRAVVAWRTSVPGRDGATYLWMAEQVAASDVGAAFRTVFHPLYSLATGALLWLLPPLPSTAAGQIVACGTAALAVWPLYLLTTRVYGRTAGRSAALLYSFGLWFARYPAECMSEGCFYLAVATWASALLSRDCCEPSSPSSNSTGSPGAGATGGPLGSARSTERTPRVRPAAAPWRETGADSRPVLAGVASGLAYATRPEGLVLLALSALCLRGRARWRAVAAGTLAALWVPLGFALYGDGFTLSPKVAFNYEVGIGADDSAVAHYLDHAWRVPGTAFETIGYVALPLALAGLWICWRQGALRLAAAAPWLVGPVLVQALVVPLLRNHVRFLSGFGVLLLPLAGLALARLVAALDASLSPRTPAVRRACTVALFFAALAPDLARLGSERGRDRRVERALGEWLRSRVTPPQFIVTEMPRLEFFAGQRPGPPRAIGREDLLHAAASPDALFVVVVAPRSHIAAGDLEALGLRAVSLPDELSALAKDRELLVYRRP
ncbi:MAG: hypothetical protein R3F56_12375 [Planctomycetota bacterium]